MPAGVEVVVQDGFATIDFVDPAKRGPGLLALINVGGPATIEKLTRGGPRVLYVVPEGNAREAGLLDEVSEVAALEKPDTSSATDATGAVPPEFPSTRDLHAQVMRSGKYATGGVIEALADGTFTELVSEDTGGPYEVLPEIESYPDGATPLDAIVSSADVDEAVPAGDAELIEIPGGGAVEPGSKAWPDGEPDDDWTRPQLNAYAQAVQGIDTRELPNKAAVVAAIKAPKL